MNTGKKNALVIGGSRGIGVVNNLRLPIDAAN